MKRLWMLSFPELPGWVMKDFIIPATTNRKAANFLRKQIPTKYISINLEQSSLPTG